MKPYDISVSSIQNALIEQEPEVLLQYLINMLYARYLKRSFNGMHKENYASLHLEVPYVRGKLNSKFDNFSFLDNFTPDQLIRAAFDCFKNAVRGVTSESL